MKTTIKKIFAGEYSFRTQAWVFFFLPLAVCQGILLWALLFAPTPEVMWIVTEVTFVVYIALLIFLSIGLSRSAHRENIFKEKKTGHIFLYCLMITLFIAPALKLPLSYVLPESEKDKEQTLFISYTSIERLLPLKESEYLTMTALTLDKNTKSFQVNYDLNKASSLGNDVEVVLKQHECNAFGTLATEGLEKVNATYHDTEINKLITINVDLKNDCDQ